MAGARENMREAKREALRKARVQLEQKAIASRQDTAARRQSQAERNAEAVQRLEREREEADRLAALSPEERRVVLRERELRIRAEQNARNAKAQPGPAENKAVTPAEENKTADALDGVPLTPAAERKARELGLTADSFKRRRKSGASGDFTVDDVERIAASVGAVEDEE